MINNSDTIIPPDLTNFLEERKQIWRTFDESRNQATKLDTFESQIPRKGNVQSLKALTDKNLPPTELAAVLPKLEQELTVVRQIQTRIQENQAEIERIKQNARNLLLVLIISGSVLFIILLILLLHAAGLF